MYGKSNMETDITICKTDSQREFAVWLRKLKQGICINLEGWDGEGDGSEFQKGGDICIQKKKSYQFSLVVFDSLQTHGPQHAKPPCPSQTLRVYSNPCPLSQ